MNQRNRAFYTLDPELRLLGASPKTLGIWGKELKDLIGRKLVEVFPCVEEGPVYPALQQARQSCQPVRLQVNSVVLAEPVEVEIYPVRHGLQVSFAPTASPV